MTVGNGRHSERLERFMRQSAGSALELDLLYFWSRHPNTRFSQSAIFHAMDGKKLDSLRALDSLVTRGLLERQVVNGVALYSLTADQEKRPLVLELSAHASQVEGCLLHYKPGLAAIGGNHRS